MPQTINKSKHVVCHLSKFQWCAAKDTHSATLYYRQQNVYLPFHTNVFFFFWDKMFCNFCTYFLLYHSPFNLITYASQYNQTPFKHFSCMSNLSPGETELIVTAIHQLCHLPDSVNTIDPFLCCCFILFFIYKSLKQSG
jgi:hypothetical protein